MTPSSLPRRAFAGALAASFVVLLAASLGASRLEAAVRQPSPNQPQDIDVSTVIDVNDIRMFVTNTGSLADDRTTGSAGFEFPKGSGKTAVYEAGLWLAARVVGQTRVAVS